MHRFVIRQIWVVLLLLSTGCAYVNRPLTTDSPAAQVHRPNRTRASTFDDKLDRDGYFVGLALSGGGSRSANFAAACMFELQSMGILQKVDCISSVSGGSLPAAYYCLNQDDWNWPNVERRMRHPFATDLLLNLIMPWNLVAQALTSWDRGDLLAGSFRDHLYSASGKQQTFADLRDDRPRLLINATDLQTGKRFIFSNDTFDELGSDLSQYPISYAVAASSAVPGLLHHVTLLDYSSPTPRYVHVLDGGIIDNLGVTTLVETYMAQVQRARDAGQPDPYPKGMILIVIDAHTTIDQSISEEPDIGVVDSLALSVGLSSTALLNRVSSATMAELIVQYSPDDATAKRLRDEIKQLTDTGSLVTDDQWHKPLRVVHLALSRMSDVSDPSAAAHAREVNNIATYFNIDDHEAAGLYAAAKVLVHDRRFAVPLNEVSQELHVTPTTAP